MPDDRNLSQSMPAGWGEAFAALPLETPDAGGWQRIAYAPARAARARPEHARWPAWAAAIAATLAAVALLSMPLFRQELANDPSPVAQVDRTPAAVVQTQPRDATGDDKTVRTAPTESSTAGTPVQASDDARTASQPARPHAATPTRSGTQAASDEVLDRRQASTTGSAAESSEATPPPVTTDPLERLYAESAQLETLLAMARDERVSSGTAAALASDFDAQVASIDAELIQPGITAARRTELWRDRVDALRQATTFESTRRLLAAQGERYDAKLVSID